MASDRRSFFELLSAPDYLKVLPYKAAALKVVLMPMHDELVVPDLRWQVAALSNSQGSPALGTKAARKSSFQT